MRELPLNEHISAQPFAAKKFIEVKGRQMAYIDEGEGDAIVFQHGNPASSYLWRNVMPHLKGLGRLVACDLIGMGDSDKLSPSGPDRYLYEEQRDYLFALWDKLDLGDRVVLVIHDWGSALGFDWAMQNPERVQGLAYMEAIVAPSYWTDWPPEAKPIVESFRSPQGEELVLQQNMMLELSISGGIGRPLSENERAEYHRPFLTPGESRRPTLSWPRCLPIEGEPPGVVRVIEAYGEFMARSIFTKLFVNAEPGANLIGRVRELCRTWPNQTEVTVRGLHFVQEESPHEIGDAVASFVKSLRGG